MRPLFVVFEGLDGTGKSTLASVVAKQLGAELLSTPPAELGGVRPVVDELYRGHPVASQQFYASTLAFASDRAREALARSESVVVDRYVLSTLVYDALRPGAVPLDTIVETLAVPDVTVFVKVPEEVRRERLASRGNLTPADREALDHAPELLVRYEELLADRPCGRVLRLVNDGSPDAGVRRVLAFLEGAR